ncbi:hypothetical protein [Liquorilactobacillus mali]|uniref:Uncharacterized protein n=1 Tax=Liquorilactobacillus mali KCTC 3596 = DSM 20444 TaxID=1046596 RepID=A0A0R2DZP6_9LACO|nr:hypothetical protein [Liquorilactobacillus mali]KRN09400.1 hypothetical protein FD00_GL001123 [Liquorilactobacillus mali KCTC 3596 = DSM 20444]
MTEAVIILLALLLLYDIVQHKKQAKNELKDIYSSLREVYRVSYTDYSLMIGDTDKRIVHWYLYDTKNKKIIETHTFVWHKNVADSQIALELVGELITDRRRKLQLMYRKK